MSRTTRHDLPTRSLFALCNGSPSSIRVRPTEVQAVETDEVSTDGLWSINKISVVRAGNMPSPYQRESLNALLVLFLKAQGSPLPQHSSLKSASALSRLVRSEIWQQQKSALPKRMRSQGNHHNDW